MAQEIAVLKSDYMNSGKGSLPKVRQTYTYDECSQLACSWRIQVYTSKKDLYEIFDVSD